MGLTVLDAGVVIGAADGSDVHHESAYAALRAAVDRNDAIVLPASAYAEALVGPYRRGQAAVDVVDGLCERLPIEVVAIDRPAARAGAALRSRHRSLKLPDALVIATATMLGADVLVTTDHRWPSAAELGFDGELVEL